MLAKTGPNGEPVAVSVYSSTVSTVPKKDIVILLPYLGLQSNQVAKRRTYTKHGPGSMDHPMDLVHGPPHGPGPWTTPWTRSMDPVHGPPHGPPLIFNRKSPLLILKFTGGQGMNKNTDSYLLLTSLRVCLVTVG